MENWKYIILQNKNLVSIFVVQPSLSHSEAGFLNRAK